MDEGRTAGPGVADGDDVRFVERLWAPPAWWVVVLALVATLAIAIGYPLGALAGVLTMLVGGGGAVWLLLRAAAVVQVRAGVLVAGRATVPLDVTAAVTVLDQSAARTLRGPGADARAYLLLRPWVSTAVRVDLADADDPTPYWYVSTRHPVALAAAVEAAAGATGAAGHRDGAG